MCAAGQAAATCRPAAKAGAPAHRCGATRRLAALASAANLRLAPHLWAGAPAFAAGLHVSAASPAAYILEYSLGANPMIHELVEEDFAVLNGSLDIPDRPGLGITIRTDFVDRYRKA